jgi:hypothetical protein
MQEKYMQKGSSGKMERVLRPRVFMDKSANLTEDVNELNPKPIFGKRH